MRFCERVTAVTTLGVRCTMRCAMYDGLCKGADCRGIFLSYFLLCVPSILFNPVSTCCSFHNHPLEPISRDHG